MTRSYRTHRLIAAIASGSIGLVAGCSSTSSIDGSSPAEAAAMGEDELQVGTVAAASTASPSLPTLDEILLQDRFVALTVALERTGLRDVIEDQEGFVLVAPIGDAFASSGADTGIEYPSLMSDSQLLEAIMRYHIVVAPSTERSWRTLNGASLDVDGSIPADVGRVDGVEVLEAISVRNGTVLVVPRLLLPVSEPFDTTTAPASD